MVHDQHGLLCCGLSFSILVFGCSSESASNPDWWVDSGAAASDATGDSPSDAGATKDVAGDHLTDEGATEDASVFEDASVSEDVNLDGPLPEGLEAGDEYDCAPTNGGVEACDGIDNDCNGEIDESFDLSSDPIHCGTCNTNCSFQVMGATVATCTAVAGTPGVCGYAHCLADNWDLDEDPSNGCEYYCVQKSTTDTTCDQVDDDCDGVWDDEVDLCSSAATCGKCGRTCNGKAHAIGACITTDPTAMDCDEFNTICVLDACEPGYVDANDNFLDGCEYECTRTDRTDPTDPATLAPCSTSDPDCGLVEYCDGIDNDCDGPVDEGC